MSSPEILEIGRRLTREVLDPIKQTFVGKDEIIDLIKSRVGKDGFVEFNEELKRGDKVVIRDGPLANLVGIFERDVEDGDRVLMLLTAISYQDHVTVERELLKKIS